MISPALCISRTSAPSTSQGVSTLMPVRSVMSSSMNSMLSFTASEFMPVDEPTFNCNIEPSRTPCANPHLLAEQLSQFARHQPVIAADRTGLRAAPAEVASMSQFGQPGHHGPVDLDVAVLPLRNHPAFFDVLEVEAAQDLRAKRRPVQLVSGRSLRKYGMRRNTSGTWRSAPWSESAAAAASSCSPAEQFLQAAKEFPDQLLLFLFRFRLRETDRARVVQETLAVLTDLGGRGVHLGLFAGSSKGGGRGIKSPLSR